MSKVTVQVVGGSPQVLENVLTVGQVKKSVGAENYTATVNGEPASDSQALNDFEFVSLAPAVKGA